MAPLSQEGAEKQARNKEKEKPNKSLLPTTKSSSDAGRILRSADKRSLEVSSDVVRPRRDSSSGEQRANTQSSNEESRAARSESSAGTTSHLRTGTSLRKEHSRGSRGRPSKLITSGRGRSSSATVHWRWRRRNSSTSDGMRRAGRSNSSGNIEHDSRNDGGNMTRQVSARRREPPEHHRSGHTTNSSGGNSRSPVNLGANTAASWTNRTRGRWLAGSSSRLSLQHVERGGSWASGRQNVKLRGGMSSSSLQKQLTALEEGSLGRSSTSVEAFEPWTFRRLHREGWESGSPQRCSAMLMQHRSTSSASLAAPHRQLSAVLYTRHSSDTAAAAELFTRAPEGTAAEGAGDCPQAAHGSGKHVYGRAITRLRATTRAVPPSLHGGGFNGGTTMGGGNAQRAKTARDVNLAAQRRRRARKQRSNARPPVSCRLRRMLRLRSFSTPDGSTAAMQYHRVYLVLGLLHHKNGGDLVQNGFICLRACDVTLETNALIAEAATFMWDRDRAPLDPATPAATRTAGAAAGGAAAGTPTHTSVAAADSCVGEGVLFNRDFHNTGATLEAETAVTRSTTGARGRGLGPTNASLNCLPPLHTNTLHTSKYGLGSAFSPMTVFTIGVRVAVKPSTPSEERKTTLYLRDYLASQLATYPFLRHYVLITKYKKRRSFWPFSRHWRQAPAFSVIGTGQYTAVLNASTQVDGLTPLEVCLVHRPRRRSSSFSKGSTNAFSFMASIAGTFFSPACREQHRSR